MSTQEIRESLMAYIAHADEKKLAALHTLLDIDAETTLTQEQIHLLNEERTLYFTQKEKSFTAAEAIQLIRGEK